MGATVAQAMGTPTCFLTGFKVCSTGEHVSDTVKLTGNPRGDPTTVIPLGSVTIKRFSVSVPLYS